MVRIIIIGNYPIKNYIIYNKIFNKWEGWGWNFSGSDVVNLPLPMDPGPLIFVMDITFL